MKLLPVLIVTEFAELSALIVPEFVLPLLNSKDDESFMSIFDNVIKQCEIEYNDDLYMDVLNQSIYPDEIKMRYLLSYELTLKDFFSREYINYQTSEKATFITKTLELNILRQLIEEVQDEKDL